MVNFVFLITMFVYLYPVYAQDNSLVFGVNEQQQIIEKMAVFLRENYVDAQKGRLYHDLLIQDLEEKRFQSSNHPRGFIRKMNDRLLEINPDKHVRIMAETPTEQTLKRENPVISILLHSMERQTGNRGFRQSGIRAGNIGYIDLTSFEPLETIRSKMVAALTLLNHVDAVIIDLRGNSGGDIGMVTELASCFFNQPVQFSSYYWRRGDYIEEYHTHKPADQINLSDVPLFILVSKRTFSAAEDFAYGMQALKRGTLIGETTGGGANPGFSFELDDRFTVFIPTGRAINPVTGTNWEATGVRPDIVVSAGNSLNVAMDKAAYAARIFRQEKDRAAVNSFWNLANLLQQKDSLPDSMLSELLSKNLIEEWTINKLAYYFLSDNAVEKAKKLLLFNTQKFSGSANAWDSLAEFYFKTGDTARAVEYYRQVLQIDASHQHARFMLDKLQAIDQVK